MSALCYVSHFCHAHYWTLLSISSLLCGPLLMSVCPSLGSPSMHSLHHCTAETLRSHACPSPSLTLNISLAGKSEQFKNVKEISVDVKEQVKLGDSLTASKPGVHNIRPARPLLGVRWGWWVCQLLRPTTTRGHPYNVAATWKGLYYITVTSYKRLSNSCATWVWLLLCWLQLWSDCGPQ